MPQNEAGMRIEAPPSGPRRKTTTPVPAATAAPPDEPPHVIAGAEGLRVMPKALLSATAFQPSSGEVVMPTKMAPPARSRATLGDSSEKGLASVPRLP